MAKPKKGLEPPRVDEADPLDLTDAPAEELGARESHDAKRFDSADLTDYDLEGSSFSECVFSQITFSATKLRGSRFVESVIADSFAPEFSAARTTWRAVRIERPRWGSAELFDSTLDSVRIAGGKIDYLNLRGSVLHDVVVENCAIGELDLGGAEAVRVALVDCRIGTLDVTNARLSSVDLRGSSFDRIDGVPGLRGAIIDDSLLADLAPAFAAHVGVLVE
jgi:uncharacterized protein YjbI with pentapeptide repeats